MQMGKLRYDPKHHHHNPHHQSNTTQKVINKNVNKHVKITYISSPLLVKACDASDFRSVVQQLTGKDSSNDLSRESCHNNKDPNIFRIDEGPPRWVMQGGEDLCATTMATEEYWNGSFYYNYNIPMDSRDEFEQDYFWKEVASSVLQSPSNVLV
ncbi:hypothetical protein RIF29_24257 [Crotalaria pallida]|uniref:VQ domain-containing protein n=1 Tax=Crotalaria pallida TaxID=3830 RepID=A0AAN9EPK2_CROPI